MSDGVVVTYRTSRTVCLVGLHVGGPRRRTLRADGVQPDETISERYSPGGTGVIYCLV